MEIGSFKTIVGQSKGLYKEKGSKFISRAYYAESEDDCKIILSNLKKEYYDARHHCYAWRVNPENERFRSNDDGEPSGTAGKPILNQLYSYELYNIIVVVIRYFGGTKLGTSGLINAYKTATIEAIEQAKIEKRYIKKYLELNFEYPLMNDIMRIIKEENLEIYDTYYKMDCVIKLTVNKSKLEPVLIRLKKLRKLNIKLLESK